MTKKVKYRTERERFLTPIDPEILTEQSHARGCDLHLILNRYKATGQLPIGNTRGEAQYMDCPDEEYDFKYMQDTIKRAESEFYALPLEEQYKHGNNPSEWLRGILSDEFIDSPEDTEASADGAAGTSEASTEVIQETGKGDPGEG